MSQFSAKSVLIIGASGGLGQQLAVDFAQQGAKVTVNYSSSQAAADKVLNQAKQTGG